MKEKDTEVATGLEVRVYRGEDFLGVSAEMSTGRWETHPAPIESNPWAYHTNIDQAVKCLIRYDNLDKQQASHAADQNSHDTDDALECDDDYINQIFDE